LEAFVQILKITAGAALGIIETAMILRAVLSWIIRQDSRLLDFLALITEPVIMPLRLLFDKMGWFEDSMIDVPFMLTFILLLIVETVLSVF
jgi:uncharacterized protein YggT (Ycf19 family)